MLTLIRNENQYIIKHSNVNIPLCLCAVKNILTRYKYFKKKIAHLYELSRCLSPSHQFREPVTVFSQPGIIIFLSFCIAIID